MRLTPGPPALSVAEKVSVTAALCQWSSAPLTVVVGVRSGQPPVLVARMVPLSPTTQPWRASGKATPQSSDTVPELRAVQVVTPPLAFPPTAQPWCGSGKQTSSSWAVVPASWGVQVAPSSDVVRMMLPTAEPAHAVSVPTTQPWRASGKDTLSNSGPPPPGGGSEYCTVHVTPPSAVTRMTSDRERSPIQS